MSKISVDEIRQIFSKIIDKLDFEVGEENILILRPI
jgi:hypothetical protein